MNGCDGVLAPDGDRRGGVQDAPWLCPPFPASVPFRDSVTPSPAPATSNRTGEFATSCRTTMTFFGRETHTVPKSIAEAQAASR